MIRLILAFTLLAMASLLWIGADLGNERDFVRRGQLGPEFKSFFDPIMLQKGVLSFRFFKKQYQLELFESKKD